MVLMIVPWGRYELFKKRSSAEMVNNYYYCPSAALVKSFRCQDRGQNEWYSGKTHVSSLSRSLAAFNCLLVGIALTGGIITCNMDTGLEADSEALAPGQ